jgi:hypothetical protein
VKLAGPEQVVLDLLLDHELLHVDPATEDVLALAAPPGHDQHTGGALNKLVANGLVSKTTNSQAHTYRLTRLGLAHARRIGELQSIAERLFPKLKTFHSPQGNFTWNALIDVSAVGENDFFACLLMIRVLEIGDLVSTTVAPRGATWTATHPPPVLSGSLADALTSSQVALTVATATPAYALPSHEPSGRIAELRNWPGYVALSTEYQGAKAWLKLALALITIVPLVIPVKFKELSLHLSIASVIYLVYHVSNFFLFLEVKQAASPAAALKRSPEFFEKMHKYHERYVERLGIVVYILIGLTVLLKLWSQHGTLPTVVKAVGRALGLPA